MILCHIFFWFEKEMNSYRYSSILDLDFSRNQCRDETFRSGAVAVSKGRVQSLVRRHSATRQNSVVDPCAIFLHKLADAGRVLYSPYNNQ